MVASMENLDITEEVDQHMWPSAGTEEAAFGIDARNPAGWTYLMEACTRGSKNLVLALIARGADVNKSTKYDGWSTLHGACANGHIDIARILVDAGVDVNKGDMKGNTPLWEVAMRDELDIADLLIHAGADVNKPSNSGETPLDIAVQYIHPRMVEFLLCNGANKYTANKWQVTPLMKARSIRSALIDTSEHMLSFGMHRDNRSREELVRDNMIIMTLLERDVIY